MPVKNCCIITKPSGRSERTRIACWKGTVLGKVEQSGSCGKKALNHQILKVVSVHYVEIKRMHSALCPTGYGALAVTSKQYGRLSVSVSQHLENGSTKPPGSSDGDRIDLKLSRGTWWATCCLVFNLMIIKLLIMTWNHIIPASPSMSGIYIYIYIQTWISEDLNPPVSIRVVFLQVKGFCNLNLNVKSVHVHSHTR
jgi:hypothetical protein